MEVGFYQFWTSRRSFGQALEDIAKRTVVGGTSITGCTLEAALGRPMHGARAPESLRDPPFDLAAISFNTPGAPMAYRAAQHLRALGRIVVADGPHPSPRASTTFCTGPDQPNLLRWLERWGRIYV